MRTASMLLTSAALAFSIIDCRTHLAAIPPATQFYRARL
jgi:hypothetical protein